MRKGAGGAWSSPRSWAQHRPPVDGPGRRLRLRDQFDRATLSILSNIGEGAGKTAQADKQRYYEIARGSTTEAATHLDVLQIRGLIPTSNTGEPERS